MTKVTENKVLSKRAFVRIVVVIIAFIVLAAASVCAFFTSVNQEWTLSKEIYSISRNLDITTSKQRLEKIAKSDRVLEVIAVSEDGTVLYTINNIPLFNDPNAVVLYDVNVGLVRFEGERVSYLERNSILGALINVGDGEAYKGDDERGLAAYDNDLIKDNTYQTIFLTDKGTGNNVYVICTQEYHAGFFVFLIAGIVAWVVYLIYCLATAAIAVSDNAKKNGYNDKVWKVIGFVPVLGVAAYLVFRIVDFAKN